MPHDLGSHFSLSRQQGTLLLRLAEREQPAISHQLLAEQVQGLHLVSAGALTMEGSSASVMLMEEDGPRAVELEWLPDRNAYGYFTPDGYVLPDPTLLQSYKLNMDWWLKWLAIELDLVGSAVPFELVKGQAWDLGSLWVSGSSKVPILFARRLKHQAIAKTLIDALNSRAGRSGGLILTSCLRSPELAIWPNRFQARSMTDFLLQDAERFKLDRDLIHGMFSPFSAAHSGERVSLSPDLRSVQIDGQVWLFRGPIQQKIIHLLVQAYRERKRLRTSEVLMQAGSQAPDFAKAFKNNPSWPHLSRYVKTHQGFCWIEL